MSSLGRKKVQRKRKIRGYTLDQDAVDEIFSFASNFDDSAPDDDAIDLLLDFLETQPGKDKETVRRLLTKLSRADAAIYDGELGYGKLVQKFRLNTVILPWSQMENLGMGSCMRHPSQKVGAPVGLGDTIIQGVSGKETVLLACWEITYIHGEASAKSALYKDRFLLLSQIISRHKEFSRPAFGSKSSDSGLRESLIGQTGRRWVMGLISQLEDGHVYLEDLSSSVEIDLSNAQITAGFFVENTIVVAEGNDFFGSSSSLIEEETLRLAKLDRTTANDNVIVLSDIWLDNEEVAVWQARADDCSPSTASRGPFNSSAYLTEELQNHIPNCIFSSNPCRLKLGTKDFVFFRQDLLYRMRRSCLYPPCTIETDDHFEHLVATITHQFHLSPLPLIVLPIIWNYDHSLYLYPTPDTIVLGDRSNQKAFKYTGVTCFNPGSFSSDIVPLWYSVPAPLRDKKFLVAMETQVGHQVFL